MLDDRCETFYDEHFQACRSAYQHFDELPVRLLVELVLTCDIATQIFSRDLVPFGLSKSAFNILMILRHGPSEGMQLHDLGELLLVSRANITGMINHLKDKGYVTRIVPDNDRRVRYARLTAEGNSLLDQFVPSHWARVKTLLSGVAEADQIEFRRLLAQIRRSLLERMEEESNDV